MKLGLILPTFADTPQAAFQTAERAERAGLDGVFCYDHIWPLGQPERPALAPFPVLGALAVRTGRVALGPLVARVGLVPDDVLVSQLATLDLLAEGRVIAGLGTGDHLSAPENLAYGVDYTPAADRLASLNHCVLALRRLQITVWVGGRAHTTDIAHHDEVAVNLWAAGPEEVARQAALGPVTWAGPAPAGVDRAHLRRLLGQLADAGAAWAVLAPGVDPDLLADAGR